MNILIITTHLNTGGITRYVFNLTKGFKARGYRVFVASYGGTWEDRIKGEGAEMVPIPLRTKSILSPKVLQSFFVLLSFLKRQPIDMVHCNARVSQAVGALLWLFKRIPYVCTFHGYYKPRWSRRILKCSGIRTLAISRSVGEHLSRDLKVPGDRVRVVYNGVDLRGYDVSLPRDEIRERYQIRGYPVVGIVARLSAEKNHKILIRAFHLFLKDFPKAVLLIAGAGRLESDLKNFVEKEELKDNVIFLRDVEIPQVFAVLDVFVLASLKEGFGFAAVEAQLVGVPVIVSNAGGVRELVQHKISGLVLEDNQNEQELYCAIKLIVEDEDLRKKIVDYARKTARERFSLEKMLDDTLAVYREILPEKVNP